MLGRRNLLTATPNAAHAALVQLEAGLAANGGALFLCTQNIDDLHERAGSRQVTHMHGELLKAQCQQCQAVGSWVHDISRQDICPSCGAVGQLRPHVVWFGEMPLQMDDIHFSLYTADMFVAIGTSGSVYPAAGFVAEAKNAGIRTCEINLKPTDNAQLFDEAHYGPASETVETWSNRTLANI